MAKRSGGPLLLSPEAREQLLAAIRAASEPLSARDLAKQLAGEHKVKEADLAPVLEEEVAAGTLYASPGKTAKGKPRYWDRDSRALGREAVLHELDRSESPLAVKELIKRIPTALRLPENEVSLLLEERIREGKVHAFPPATSKGKTSYWTRDPVQYGRRAIVAILDEKGPQAEASLKKSVKGISGAVFGEALESALAAGEAWRHPPVGKTKKSLIGSRPPSPEPYLRDVGKKLAEIIGRLIQANVPLAELRRALVQLVEAAGVPFSSATNGERAPASDGQTPAVDLLGLMRRLEPGADRGALVGTRNLRRASRLEKGPFDRAVLELARKGSVSLHQHDFPANLSPEEREELVTDGDGTYFIGIAIRQGG